MVGNIDGKQIKKRVVLLKRSPIYQQPDHERLIATWVIGFRKCIRYARVTLYGLHDNCNFYTVYKIIYTS